MTFVAKAAIGRESMEARTEERVHMLKQSENDEVSCPVGRSWVFYRCN